MDTSAELLDGSDYWLASVPTTSQMTSLRTTTDYEYSTPTWGSTYPLVSGIILWSIIITTALLCRQCCMATTGRCSSCYRSCKLCLSQTWPFKHCVSAPTEADDEDTDERNGGTSDDPPDYSVALNMPKPEHHHEHGTHAQSHTAVNIPMTELNGDDTSRTSATPPPPQYSNEGCLFPDSDEDDVSITSSLTDDDASHHVETVVNIEHGADNGSEHSDDSDNALPSYQVAIRSLGIENPLHEQIVADEQAASVTT